MSRPAFLLPALLCALAGLASRAQAAVDAPVATPPIQLVISDGQRLVDRWKASIYFTLWQDPANAEGRALFGKHLDEAAGKLGFAPCDALAALRGGVLSIKGLNGKGDEFEPFFSIQAGFGALTPKVSAGLIALAKRHGAAPVIVPGAAEAIQFKEPAGIMARIGQAVILGNHLAPIEVMPITPPTSEADIQASVSVAPAIAGLDQLAGMLPGNIKQLAGLVSGTEAAGLDLKDLLGDDQDYQLRIVPEGQLERFTSTATVPDTRPVDRTLFARLPANTLVALACGVEGQALWKSLRTPLFTGLADKLGTPGATVDEVEAHVDQLFAQADLDCTLAQLVAGLTGTTLVALTPSAPFPALIVVLPRSPALDHAMARLCARQKIAVPAEGTTALLTIEGLPLPLQIGMDQATWFCSSDAQVAMAFAAGARGGWAEGPTGALALGKAPTDAFLIGGSATGDVLRLISQFAGPVLAAGDLPVPRRRAIIQLLAKAASLAAPGYVFAGTQDGRTCFEDRSLFGIFGSVTALGLLGFEMGAAGDQALPPGPGIP